jgi:hypothetical protein
MSVTAEPQTYTCERERCQSTFTPTDAVGGSYCSADCYYREKGAGLIEKIRSDPDHCGTCFKPTKTGGTDPTKLHRSCRAAYAGRTDGPVCPDCRAIYDRTEYLRERPVGDKLVRAEDADLDHRPVYRYDWGCGGCGSTDPNDTHRILQTGGRVIERRRDDLFRCLSRLAEKGAIDGRPSYDRLLAAYREHPSDWAYQAGWAVYRA